MTSTSPSAPHKSAKKRSGSRGWFTRAQEYWYEEFRKIVGAWVFVVVIIVMGTIFVAIVDTTDYVFSTMTFCGTTCHVMEVNVFKELKKSTHWTSPTGVRATCADCHVGGRLSFAMVDHFVGTGELFVWLTHDLSQPGAFERLRPAGADRVRFQMIENDSARCRSCHEMEAIKPERIRGQNQHDDALENGTTCIICHYNLVHKEVDPSPAFQKAIEAAIDVSIEEEPELEAGEDEEEVL